MPCGVPVIDFGCLNCRLGDTFGRLVHIHTNRPSDPITQCSTAKYKYKSTKIQKYIISCKWSSLVMVTEPQKEQWASVLSFLAENTKIQQYRNTKWLPRLDRVWQGLPCNDDWASQKMRQCLRFRCKKAGKDGETARGLIPLKKNGKQGSESLVLISC